MKIYFLSLLTLLSFSCVRYDVIKRVLDGDTVITESGERLRLNNLDAVELHQPYGYEAKQFLESLILGKQVRIVTHGKDKFDRTIADIYLDGYVNMKIVDKGYAYCYRKYSTDEMYRHELAAKTKRIGIWSGNNIVPFKWRLNHK